LISQAENLVTKSSERLDSKLEDFETTQYECFTYNRGKGFHDLLFKHLNFIEPGVGIKPIRSQSSEGVREVTYHNKRNTRKHLSEARPGFQKINIQPAKIIEPSKRNSPSAVKNLNSFRSVKFIPFIRIAPI
jgi:hypothetical protein